jgi:hypothetical protein
MAFRQNSNLPPHEGQTLAGNIRSQTDDTVARDPSVFGESPAPDSAEEGLPQLTEAEALRIAKEAYTTSTDYLDANFRKQWETDLRYFDGRHSGDSKYYKKEYAHRNKTFRPKSRSISRRLEALTAAAFFSNQDLLSCEALNQADSKAVASANMQFALLQYRLKNTLPWFLTVVGGMQDAVKTGVVCSYNYWSYKTKKKKKITQVPYTDASSGQPAIDPQTGQPMMFDKEEIIEVPVADKPEVCLTPVENIRLSPNAKWDDPINSSPYVGRMVPMYVSEIRARMMHADRSGRKWKDYSDAEIKSKGKLESFDSTRQTRQGQRQDPVNDTTEVKDYEISWCIEWYVERDNERFVYWTLGTDLLLSDPEPLEDVYLHNRIPITMGYCVIETHKVMPKGPIGIGGALQREINNTTNNRADNVALVLNKQYAIRAGQQVDTTNLMYGVPGGVTAFQNPQTDIVPLEWNDVTSSAYQEEDRFNVGYDELVGNFSSSSVMTNRRLNETVGGLEILGEGAATLSEATVRTFTETWLIPTLTQIGLLEQYYETDQIIMTLAAQYAQAAYRPLNNKDGKYPPSQEDLVADLINANAIIRIDMGMLATDPNRKLSRLMAACKSVADFSQHMPPAANTAEMAKEVFRIMGYGDGSRFWDADQQMKTLLMNAQQQATGMIQQAQQLAEQLFKEAEKRQRAAETAEARAMEEQMQLLKQVDDLIKRGFAAAMKEVQLDHSSAMAKKDEETAKLKLDLAAAKAAKSAKVEPTITTAPKATPPPPVHVAIHMPKPGSKKATFKKNPDGSTTVESSTD